MSIKTYLVEIKTPKTNKPQYVGFITKAKADRFLERVRRLKYPLARLIKIRAKI